MSFKDTYPEFAAIEGHIKRAHAERSVYIASIVAEAILGAVRVLKRLVHATGSGIAAERERHAIEADSFLKRSVPRY